MIIMSSYTPDAPGRRFPFLVFDHLIARYVRWWSENLQPHVQDPVRRRAKLELTAPWLHTHT